MYTIFSSLTGITLYIEIVYHSNYRSTRIIWFSKIFSCKIALEINNRRGYYSRKIRWVPVWSENCWKCDRKSRRQEERQCSQVKQSHLICDYAKRRVWDQPTHCMHSIQVTYCIVYMQSIKRSRSWLENGSGLAGFRSSSRKRARSRSRSG